MLLLWKNGKIDKAENIKMSDITAFFKNLKGCLSLFLFFNRKLCGIVYLQYALRVML